MLNKIINDIRKNTDKKIYVEFVNKPGFDKQRDFTITDTNPIPEIWMENAEIYRVISPESKGKDDIYNSKTGHWSDTKWTIQCWINNKFFK